MKFRATTLFLLLAALILQAAWLVPEAELRLRAEFPPYGRQFLIPMPTGVEYSSCLAYDGQGTPFPASVIPGIGIRLDLSDLGKKRRSGGLTLYLCKSKHPKDLLCKNDKRVKASLVRRPVTTRAFTAQEIMRHFGMLKITASTEAHAAYVSKLGELPQSEQWKFSDNSHACHAIRWEALLKVSEDESLVFGTKQANTAWTILVDGEPVADWSSAEQKDGLCKGRPVEIAKGAHTIQLLSLLRPNEAPPEAFILRQGKPEPITGDAEFSPLPGFSVETKAKPEAGASFFYHATSAFDFIATGGRICVATVQAKGALFIGQDGNPLSPKGDTLMHDARVIPGIRLGELSFPAIRYFQPARPLFLRARISDSPLLVAHNGALSITLTLDADEEAVPLLAHATLTTRILQGESLLSQQEEPLNGRCNLVCSIPSLPKEADSLRFHIAISGIEAAQPARLQLVRPSRAQLPLTAVGNALYCYSERALLICDPLGTKYNKAETATPIPSLSILDAFTGESTTLHNSLKLEELLKQRLPQLELKQVIFNEADSGCTAAASLLSRLHLLVSGGTGRALLLNGLANLKEQEEPLKNATLMLYMIQACQAKGMEPIPVCLPPLPGLSQANARLNALYTKEIALARGIPVLDLYSKQLSKPVSTAAWYEEKSIATAVPNDHAYEWLAEQIAAFLKQR